MVVDFLSSPPFFFLKLDFGFRRSFIYWHVRPYPKRWRVSEWFYGCLCRRFRGFTGLRLILCKFLAPHLCPALVIRIHTLLPLRFLKTPASKIHMWFRKLNEVFPTASTSPHSCDLGCLPYSGTWDFFLLPFLVVYFPHYPHMFGMERSGCVSLILHRSIMYLRKE